MPQRQGHQGGCACYNCKNCRWCRRSMLASYVRMHGQGKGRSEGRIHYQVLRCHALAGLDTGPCSPWLGVCAVPTRSPHRPGTRCGAGRPPNHQQSSSAARRGVQKWRAHDVSCCMRRWHRLGWQRAASHCLYQLTCRDRPPRESWTCRTEHGEVRSEIDRCLRGITRGKAAFRTWRR